LAAADSCNRQQGMFCVVQAWVCVGWAHLQLSALSASVSICQHLSVTGVASVYECTGGQQAE
jgi:hypothetical protein